jgi:hypothetical protein
MWTHSISRPISRHLAEIKKVREEKGSKWFENACVERYEMEL